MGTDVNKLRTTAILLEILLFCS